MRPAADVENHGAPEVVPGRRVVMELEKGFDTHCRLAIKVSEFFVDDLGFSAG
jgi:hypothetical protein